MKSKSNIILKSAVNFRCFFCFFLWYLFGFKQSNEEFEKSDAYLSAKIVPEIGSSQISIDLKIYR